MSTHVLSPSASFDDLRLAGALRGGDEAAFASLVASHSSALLRLALAYVRSPAVAHEVVRDTWLAVIRGIDRFEGRSSLRTWIFGILTATATETQRGSHTPTGGAAADDAPSVDPARFLGREGGDRAGHWTSSPARWDALPEERRGASDTLAVVRDTIDGLASLERIVITLRDVQGWEAGDVCELLELSETDQRVVLHRGRSKVRAALERHLAA